MWNWFFENSMWFIISSISLMALFFFFSFRPQIKQSLDRITSPKFSLPRSKAFSLIIVAVSTVGLRVTSLSFIVNVVFHHESNVSTIVDVMQTWLVSHGIPILSIVLISYLVYRLLKSMIPHLIDRSVKVRYIGDESERTKRSQTLNRIVVSAIGALIITIAVLMVLAETGRDITPLLAGAGIAGVAIGFGAQSLVKDILNGLFIILEDQYRKGDVVKIADISGLVEDLSLRRTVLRDMDGTVHTIPNGQVVTASNYTKEWSRVNFDVPVAYYEDIDRVMKLINRVGTELAEDPDYESMIITPPKALRVNDLNDKGIMIRVYGDTKPLKQWEVAGEMRKRIKIAFDKEDIAMPWAYGGVFGGKKADLSVLVCPQCGFPNPLTGKYCGNCGAILKQAGNPG